MPDTLFYERQNFRPKRMRLLTAIVPAGMLLLTIVQVGFGFHWGAHTNGSLIGWTIFLWLVYWRLMLVRLVTEVRPNQIRVALRGLWRSRKIPFDEIVSAQAVSFDPAGEWGGYGIRVTRRGRAYIAGGNQGVELQTKRGLILVGSTRPAELAGIITSRLGGRA